MTVTTIRLDPITRLEGHLEVELDFSTPPVPPGNYKVFLPLVTKGQESSASTTPVPVASAGQTIVDARSGGMMFRGFENLLIGKLPQDAVYITQRICGVCPISHAMAACLAVEQAAGLSVPDNARIIRNLILGSEYIHSHILHFYHLSLLSYIKGPAMAPWTPTWDVDMRFSSSDNQLLVDHYVQALAARRQAHEMASIFGGKNPHTAAYEAGGVLVAVDSSMISRFIAYLNPLISFIDNIYLPDVDLLGQTYPEYYAIGRGYGNLLAFGVFDLNASGSMKLLGRGRVEDGSTSVLPVSLDAILEQTRYSWFTDSSLNPAQGQTQPNNTKTDAYSWLKAPRYNGAAYEAGPLARMWINGDYRRGISVMDRHQARALEASKVAHAMLGWVAQINPSAAFYNPYTLPTGGSGVGLTEAPRGALGHWLKVANSQTSSYQILTPTCWNCSPRDNAGVLGPLEKALLGIPVLDSSRPVEALRVVHSYDPCLSCAVH
jgi:hydrogenase large subunit